MLRDLAKLTTKGYLWRYCILEYCTGDFVKELVVVIHQLLNMACSHKRVKKSLQAIHVGTVQLLISQWDNYLSIISLTLISF